jgi:hypothetical protein
MRLLKLIIRFLWLLPIIILLSPFHDFPGARNLSLLTPFILVYLITIPLDRPTKTIEKSFLENKKISNFFYYVGIAVAFVGLPIIIFLLNNSENFYENRQLYDEKFQPYNYLVMLGIFPIISLSLSNFISDRRKCHARICWVVVITVLLISGNRQLTFFSVILYAFYYIGTSKKPRELLIKLLIITPIIFLLAIFFSIKRLAYLGDFEAGKYERYLSTLTGLSCNVSENCDNLFGLTYQLIYAYIGINFQNFINTIDFYYSQDEAFPIFSSSFPIIYRRFSEYLGNRDVAYYNELFGKFTEDNYNFDYSHFFSTMFGTVALECGWPGVVSYSIILYLLLKRSIILFSNSKEELDYLTIIIISSSMVFGLLQFPFTEPFFSGLIIFLLICVFYKKIYR